jgi:hypothetical protein
MGTGNGKMVASANPKVIHIDIFYCAEMKRVK